ncbi:2-keto-4-pentenoate hydratase [uncultured Psychrobacter sp.]|uniref:2-keto-4-pentenoate hydratase n=1 Tax=uncultured Psychrobacter sp. TaxID=259303 RepID=UPI00345B3D38
MSNKHSPANLAPSLFDAYKKGAVAPLRHQVDVKDIALAYQIQQENHRRWSEQGRVTIGRKIGLTSTAVQAQLGVDQPDYGMVYADTCYCSGAQIPASQFLQPKIEAEIAFVLKSDLDADNLTIIDVINAVDYAVAALEIVDSRVENWDISLFDTIADNASYGGIIMGTTPVPLSQLDLENCQMQLSKGNEVVSEGEGRACLGNPLLATLWLANMMIENGQPLRAGDVVLSGALGPMIAVESNDTFSATIDGLNSVSVSFTE